LGGQTNAQRRQGASPDVEKYALDLYDACAGFAVVQRQLPGAKVNDRTAAFIGKTLHCIASHILPRTRLMISGNLAG
jgi:hypothetical protein